MSTVHTYFSDLKTTIDRLPMDTIEQVIDILHEARLSSRQIFIMGNGGSASTASHFACDLAKNTRKPSIPNFRVLGLADNIALITAYGNDEGFENIFAQQLASFVRAGDVVIGISTSGNSPNILKAIQLANETQATTIGFTGFDGGKLSKLVDIDLHVDSHCIEHVEDIHLMLEHLVTKALRERAMETTTLEEIFPSRLLKPTVPSVAIHSDGSQNHVDKARAYLEMLYNLGRDMDPHLDQERLLQRILEVSLDSIGAASGSIMIFDENRGVRKAALAYAGEIRSQAGGYLNDTLENGLAGWVVENRQAALVPSTRDDPRWLWRSYDENNGPRSAVSVPLMDGQRVIGVLTLVHSQAEYFTRDDLALVAAIAVCITLIAPISYNAGAFVQRAASSIET